MAVLIKQKTMNLLGLVEQLFEAESVAGGLYNTATKLQGAGYVLSTSPTVFSITKDGTIFSSVALKRETVTLAMQNKVGYNVKVKIRDKITSLISVAYDKVKDYNLVDEVLGGKSKTFYKSAKDPEVKEQVLKAVFTMGMTNKVKGIKLCRQLTGLSLKEAKELTEAWMDSVLADPPELPEMHSVTVDGKQELHYTVVDDNTEYPPVGEHKSIKNQYASKTAANVIPLKEATKLHQPVGGTTNGSIYHVIAVAKDVNVAIRIRDDNDVMIRAELRVHPNTTEGQQVKTALLTAGLDKKPKGHYSLNLEPEDFDMVQRSIGSTLFSTGITFDMVSTQLKLLKGAGQ